MIVRFRHKGLKLLYERGDRRRIPPAHVPKVERILARLDQATGIRDMDLPGFRLHALKGGLTGRLLVRKGVGQLANRVPVRGRPRDRRQPGRLPLKEEATCL